MYRTRVAVILSVVLVGMLTLSAHSAMGGCHGGCVSPTGGASDSCDGNILTSAIKPMDRVTTGADPTTDLRLYSIRLGAGDQTESNILVGEATAFYVTSGAISFTIDPDAGAESVYVKGTDVYVVGWQNNGTKDVAMLWKNGVAVPLTTGTTDAFAGGVFVK